MGITQRKGDIATSQAIASFTKLGWDVSIPLTESAKYDLIVDTGKNLERVQCKYSNRTAVDIRGSWSNTKGTITTYYSPNDFDWLYIYYIVNNTEYLMRFEDMNKTCAIINDRFLLHNQHGELPEKGLLG